MYAIIRTGGKQYQVACGDQLRVEKINGNVGDIIEMEDVLMVVDGENAQIGRPVLSGAKVVAKIAEQGKARKVLVFKKRRRQGYQVKMAIVSFILPCRFRKLTHKLCLFWMYCRHSIDFLIFYIKTYSISRVR